MNKAITIFMLTLAVIGGFLIFYNPKPASSPTENTSEALDATQKWESMSDEQASVTVTVTPFDLGAKSKEWKFAVAMDTHSVELDQDIAKAVILTDDSGNEYKPLRWEGAPEGGHHREGMLIFSPITPTPESIELKITGIVDTTRSFRWQLE